MRGYIRTDGSPGIGMGHVSRCLAIARELAALGAEPCFLARHEEARQAAEAAGFACRAPAAGLPYSPEEAEELRALAGRERAAFFLVDSYQAGDGYLARLESAAPTFCMDGGYRCRAEISGVINHNAAADPEEYCRRFAGRRTRLLIGPAYAPVGTQFLRARQARAARTGGGEASRILVTSGATDCPGFLYAFCRSVLDAGPPAGSRYHVVLGGLYGDGEPIAALTKDCEAFQLYRDVKDMAGLMAGMDLAVSAAGTTVYELLCAGVPTLVYGTVPLHRTFERLAPAAIWMGDVTGDTDGAAARIAGACRRLARDGRERERLTRAALGAVDGLGARRIARTILAAGAN